MEAAANKGIVEAAFDALAEGDGRPLNALLADDAVWIVEGSGPWSLAYSGKGAIREELQRPLLANFATTYRCRADRILAEGDTVVVLARGDVMTRSGEPYANSYCFVMRLAEGRIVEIREYMDTALAGRVLARLGTG